MRYYQSPVGLLAITMFENKLAGLARLDRPASIENKGESPEVVTVWLDAYFNGARPSGRDLPLALKGTDFQRRVWERLLQIPYGQCVTYGQIAGELNPASGRLGARAVGSAVAKNPVGIVVPCHRVIGANNNLTGYAWGLDMKIKLLNLEGVDTSKMKGAR